MAQGKSSNSGGSGRPGGPGRPTNRPGGKPGSGRRGPGASAAAAKRPPTKRKKNKSIVNQKQTPWGLIATIAAVVVFAVAIVVVVIATHHSAPSGVSAQVIPSTPTGAVTKQEAVKRVANTTGIKGVIAYDTEGWPGNGDSYPGALQHVHVTGPVDYSLDPPAGGPHNAVWMNAGVYTKPVPSERAVHNLEHGAIWITYDPDLPKSEIATLQAFVAKQSLINESAATGIAGQQNRYMDLTPWATNTLPTPIVMSSWGYQLRLTSPTDPRMQKFVDMFRNSSKYTPEYGSPVDGQPVSTSGRAAYDGATKPNPTS